MGNLFIFGLGYSASRIAASLIARGWRVEATGSAGTVRFDDEGAVGDALRRANHVLSSVPPAGEGDPVLARYAGALRGKRLCYLSSTGVYGDTGGAWVDESAPAVGRRSERNEADAAWLTLGARVFRLPGIYGPGRSVLDRLRAETAHRIDLPGQVFSRVHVDDIAAGDIRVVASPPASLQRPPHVSVNPSAVSVLEGRRIRIEVVQHEQMRQSVSHPVVEVRRSRLVVPPAQQLTVGATLLVLEPARSCLDLRANDEAAVKATAIARLHQQVGSEIVFLIWDRSPANPLELAGDLTYACAAGLLLLTRPHLILRGETLL